MLRTKYGKLILMIAALCLCAVFLLTACGQNQSNTEEPDPSDPSDTADPDDNSGVIPHTEHNWVKGATTDGTCIEFGYTTETCSIGGETRQVSTGKKGEHQYINHICSLCGARQPGAFEYDAGPLHIYCYTWNGGKYNLVVTGSGAMSDFASKEACPWAEIAEEVGRIEFLTGVTYVGAHFADGMTELSQLIVSASVAGIGPYAFNGCEHLTSFAAGEALVSIGSYAFAGCRGLHEVTLARKTRDVGKCAFAGCAEMRGFAFGGSDRSDADEPFFFGSMFEEAEDGDQVVVADGKTYSFRLPQTLLRVYVVGDGKIPERFFENCGIVENLYVQGGVTEIGDHAFYGMPALKYVEFTTSTLVTIGEEAFARCASLGAPKRDLEDEESSTRPQTIVFPSSLNEIGFGAFQFCGELVNVELNGTYVAIPNCAFMGCSKLANVKLSSTVETVGEEAFASTSLAIFHASASMRFLGTKAFDGCSKLVTLVVDSEDLYYAKYDYSMIFGSVRSVWVSDAIVSNDQEGKDKGNSYIKTKMTYKGQSPGEGVEADYRGYHLWEK